MTGTSLFRISTRPVPARNLVDLRRMGYPVVWSQLLDGLYDVRVHKMDGDRLVLGLFSGEDCIHMRMWHEHYVPGLDCEEVFAGPWRQHACAVVDSLNRGDHV